MESARMLRHVIKALRGLVKPGSARRRASAPPLPGFDPDYYLKSNSDVRTAGIDPQQHFLQHGWKEGRDPSLGFSLSGYLNRNPDVRHADINPLLHFLENGLVEGREVGLRPHLVVMPCKPTSKVLVQAPELTPTACRFRNATPQKGLPSSRRRFAEGLHSAAITCAVLGYDPPDSIA